jgi:metal-responsive CopG/Arc/MetJ family transcriptional regulator
MIYDNIHIKIPKPEKDRFQRALSKRLQRQSDVLRDAIRRYCEDAERMGTDKTWKP